MRNIKYILINETPSENRARRPNARRDRNLGYHYIVTSEGVIRNPIDIRQDGSFMPAPVCGQEDLNLCSIGIHCNGLITDPAIRAMLIDLLVELRFQFPDAKILGASEYDRHQIKVSDDMNQLRFELSNMP